MRNKSETSREECSHLPTYYMTSPVGEQDSEGKHGGGALQKLVLITVKAEALLIPIGFSRVSWGHCQTSAAV